MFESRGPSEKKSLFLTTVIRGVSLKIHFEMSLNFVEGQDSFMDATDPRNTLKTSSTGTHPPLSLTHQHTTTRNKNRFPIPDDIVEMAVGRLAGHDIYNAQASWPSLSPPSHHLLNSHKFNILNTTQSRTSNHNVSTPSINALRHIIFCPSYSHQTRS